MELIEHKISNLISSQFPSFYQEEGEIFIIFLQKYYEWMELNNETLYHSRRLFEYTDIDETVDEFLVYFKETYLKNIQIDTSFNTRQLIKHSLDLYRSKGSERALKLLFKIVFGSNAKIYYPDKDIFRLSAGKYYEPKYLEVTLNEKNSKFVGFQITGLKSKAVGFVERVIRKTYQGKITDIFYLSAIKGNFQVGEKIDFSNKTMRNEVSPTIIGSLGEIEVDVEGSGSDFNEGEIVDVFSETGSQAKGRVKETSSISGILDYELIEGGYGYTSNSTVLFSEKIISVSNSSVPNLFEGIYQPLANINYLNANNSFEIGDYINSYYANNSLAGTAEVLKVYLTDNTSGTLFVQVISGNISTNTIYTSGNLVAANVSVTNGFFDLTATANVCGYRNTNSGLKIGIANVTNQFYTDVYTYTTETLITDTITSISHGASGNVGYYGNNLLYTETIDINTDLLKTYANVQLNASQYNFPANTTANIAAKLSDVLTILPFTFGKIQTLTNQSPGHDYSDKPIISVIETHSLPFRIYNQFVHITPASGQFSVGEVITQNSTNARALVVSANTSVLYVQPLRVLEDNQIINGDYIRGSLSGANAYVDECISDHSSLPVGYNANINSILTTSNNAISKIDVVDSGFSFEQNQYVTIRSSANNFAQGIASLKGLGKSRGFYKEIGGTLSGSKRLYDGYYYQEYSYDVISSVNLEKYRDILKKVVHTAGDKFFGTLRKEAVININKNKISKKIKIS